MVGKYTDLDISVYWLSCHFSLHVETLLTVGFSGMCCSQGFTHVATNSSMYSSLSLMITMSTLEVVTATLRGMVASVDLRLLATLCALSHVLYMSKFSECVGGVQVSHRV